MKVRSKRRIDFLGKLKNLIEDQSEWSQKTFGSDSERGPIGPLKHLAKEASEAVEAYGSSEYFVELADCFIILLDAIRRSGLSFEGLVALAMEKMKVNKTRVWSKPSSDEPVEHVRDNDSNSNSSVSNSCESDSVVKEDLKTGSRPFQDGDWVKVINPDSAFQGSTCFVNGISYSGDFLDCYTIAGKFIGGFAPTELEHADAPSIEQPRFKVGDPVRICRPESGNSSLPKEFSSLEGRVANVTGLFQEPSGEFFYRIDISSKWAFPCRFLEPFKGVVDQSVAAEKVAKDFRRALRLIKNLRESGIRFSEIKQHLSERIANTSSSCRSRDVIPSGYRLLDRTEERLASDAYWSQGCNDWILITKDRVEYADRDKWYAIRQVQGEIKRITTNGFEVL